MAYIMVPVENISTGEKSAIRIDDSDPVPFIASGYKLDENALERAQAWLKQRMGARRASRKLIGSVLLK